jgi:hypothetical protein
MRAPSENLASTESDLFSQESGTLADWFSITEEDVNPEHATVARLVELIPCASCAPTIIEGEGEAFPQGKFLIEAMTLRAVREKNAAFFRRMDRACELANGQRKRHTDLVEQIRGAYDELLWENGGVAPTRRELKEKLGLVRGGKLWRVYDARYVRKCLAEVEEEMLPSIPPDWWEASSATLLADGAV